MVGQIYPTKLQLNRTNSFGAEAPFLDLCAAVYMCFVVTCWERVDLLGMVCGVLL